MGEATTSGEGNRVQAGSDVAGESSSPPHHGVDLASHRPGHSVLAKIHQLLQEAMGSPAEGQSSPNEVRSWAVGFLGEEAVGLELARLSAQWHVLHAIPVGEMGSDIDHLVIGPGGAFTINAKCHLGRRVDIRGDHVFVGATCVPYIPKALREAHRATQALGPILPAAFPVSAVVCFVGATVRHREHTDSVRVVSAAELVDMLVSLPQTLTPGQVSAAYERARRSTTWTHAAPPQAAPDWVAGFARSLAEPAMHERDRSPRTRPARPGGTRKLARARAAGPARPSKGGLGRRRWLAGVLVAVAGVMGLGSGLRSAWTALPTSVLTPPTTTSSSAYLAPDTMPMAVVGSSCNAATARGRAHDNQLLLCRQLTSRQFIWVYADPWLRLPVGVAGASCPALGAHARAASGDGAVLCSTGASSKAVWTRDREWVPSARATS